MLTDEQVLDGIRQLTSHCRLLVEGYEAGVREYTSISAREGLYTLGFTADDTDQIIEEIANRGFKYCLDPQIAATHFDPNNPKAVNDMVTDHPDAMACYWGCDQLLSRLQSLYPSVR